MQLKTKFGVALIACGIGVTAAWNLWTKTRKFVPLNVSISLAAGQSIAQEFHLNFDGLYLIEIEAENTLPPETLHCLMGVEADLAQCKEAAIEATWELSSNGQMMKTGNSNEAHTAPVQSAEIARVIGEFQGKSGQDYKLQVTSTSDGSHLEVARPRLKVCVASIAYTDLQSAGVLVFSTSFIFVLFGVVLVSITYFSRGKEIQ